MQKRCQIQSRANPAAPASKFESWRAGTEQKRGRAVSEELAALLVLNKDIMNYASVSGKELDVSASDVAPVLLAQGLCGIFGG